MKTTKMLAILVLALGLAVGGFAQAATITVGPGAGYDFDTIQEGIDATVDGDTVLVEPGEYVITAPITFRGKAFTVQSEAGRDETTIRMGTPADTNRASVVVFENNETATSVLDGFTITGGTGTWAPAESALIGGGILFDGSSGTVSNCAIVQNRAKHGGGVIAYSGSFVTLIDCIIAGNSAEGGSCGGVICWKDSLATLIDCTITGNSSVGHGGGVYCGGQDSSQKSSLTMTDCVVSGNSSADAGGGVACWYGSLTLTRCAILNNTGGYYFGGGVYAGHGSATLTNCVIARNTVARGGGGVACSYWNASLTISNCTIWGNSGGALYGGGGVLCREGSATVTNSIIWGNTSAKGREISVQDPASTLTIAYSNVAGGQAEVNVESGCTLDWSVGNIDADPCFADPANDDYYLKSEAGRWDSNSQSWAQDAVTSPCIDAGDSDSDWRPELWPHGTRANMGTYGGTLQASRSLSDAGNVADLNRDGIVDSVDMCIMVDHWHTDEPSCDIAPAPFGDGIVDVQDLIVLAEHLFEVFPPVE